MKWLLWAAGVLLGWILLSAGFAWVWARTLRRWPAQ